jgi:FMN-dependent NADH-azoreductase
MARLLHISASPRGQASESLRIAGTFVDVYRDANPHDEIDSWDLWDATLPEFGRAAAAAKMAVLAGGEPLRDEARAWDQVQAAVARFLAAERLLFSVPMWNAGIPYVLKQFIDVVSQPGTIFGIDPHTGYQHLLAGSRKKAAVIYTSGVWGPDLGPEFGSNFQSTYFADWLRWTGIGDITVIRFHPTLSGDVDDARLTADADARAAAKAF